ncbi:dethiobiotin synthase [Glycomyces buryatensis]|uniref:ATP-dependent dethiobiotin synthetase BioD n=1 Tax=Glycomyces buryatensis TaxID=2570927 RepID=A0A4S8Q5E4_9ACTN|nr:dethiobiotin synthase [Glycomyces buryatensis]THV39493.1 dethiobiotin synthase [Glycomyces buryatensis]
MINFEGPVLVTGTDTGVGKTITTAALAVALMDQGKTVDVVKLAQTGDDDDAEVVNRLSGAPARCLARYPDPLAPFAAARRAEAEPLKLPEVADLVLDSPADVVLLEGAGGLLVQMGEGGWTVRDLAVEVGCPAVVVARAGLGTLNHTALTLEALSRRGIEAAVVIGSWPYQPGLAEFENLIDLPGERLGWIPGGAGEYEPEVFRRLAPEWLDLTGRE